MCNELVNHIQAYAAMIFPHDYGYIYIVIIFIILSILNYRSFWFLYIHNFYYTSRYMLGL